MPKRCLRRSRRSSLGSVAHNSAGSVSFAASSPPNNASAMWPAPMQAILSGTMEFTCWPSQVVRQKWPCRFEYRLRLLQRQFQNRATCPSTVHPFEHGEELSASGSRQDDERYENTVERIPAFLPA